MVDQSAQITLPDLLRLSSQSPVLGQTIRGYSQLRVSDLGSPNATFYRSSKLPQSYTRHARLSAVNKSVAKFSSRQDCLSPVVIKPKHTFDVKATHVSRLSFPQKFATISQLRAYEKPIVTHASVGTTGEFRELLSPRKVNLVACKKSAVLMLHRQLPAKKYTKVQLTPFKPAYHTKANGSVLQLDLSNIP